MGTVIAQILSSNEVFVGILKHSQTTGRYCLRMFSRNSET